MMAVKGPYSWLEETKMTGVHLAAWFGLKDIIIVLLQNGYVPDTQDSHGRTPLSYSAERGHVAVVKLLLRTENVEVDPKDDDNQTPLLWAALEGHEVVVKLLLKKGADTAAADRHGWTPLHWASQSGHVKVIKLLSGSG
jgi:ankyrin repeat protein